jgi:glycogen synthase
MKVYDYAKQRNIKSRVLVKHLQQMGINTVKNHLSLIPEKLIDELDRVNFKELYRVKKSKVNQTILTLSCFPFHHNLVAHRVKETIEKAIQSGNKVTVVLPLDLSSVQNLSATWLQELKFTYGESNDVLNLYTYLDDGITYYFIVNDELFRREQLYGYSDDPIRFAYIAKVLIHLLESKKLTTDQIDLHDWPFGLFPILIKQQLKQYFIKTCYHLYHATYHGIYDATVLEWFGLNESIYERVEHAQSVNFTKAALVSSDQVIFENESLESFKTSYLKSSVYDNL